MSGGIRRVDDADELAGFFSDIPAAHIYAQVDLEDRYWHASRWYRRSDAVVGFVTIDDSDLETIYAVSTRDPAGSLGLLVDLGAEVRPGVLATGPTGLGDALARIGPVAWREPCVRYVLTDPARLPAADPRIEALGADDANEILGLYANEPGAAFFLPNMLADQSYVGIREQGELVAVAGTHVLSETKRMAALGGVYTRPSHRGRGLGRAVSAGVIARITDRIDLIGLNTAAANRPARSVYESIGFEPVLEYEEAALTT